MTNKIDGKITDTQQIELSSDLKNLTITVYTEGRSEPKILEFERQKNPGLGVASGTLPIATTG